MDFGLKDRVALVAASCQGLGYAVALGLAREGAKLAICSRNAGSIAEAKAKLEAETGVEVYAAACDVTVEAEVKAFVGAAAQRFHGCIDICVTNAGGPPFKPFAATTLDDWQTAIGGCLMSTVYFAREVLPLMQARKWGRFLTITSVSVKKPLAGLVLSNSIRAAVDGLVKTLSVEYAKDNILVNNLCPGFTATDRLKEAGNIEAISARLPFGRVATPEEFAALAVFLSSNQASYLSGESIAVDGASRWS
jgi:3-oxoacyl-[acyl-carrier protein] reductase